MRNPRRQAVFATVLVSFVGTAARAAAPDTDAVTERAREILRRYHADSEWGADPPAKEAADRGEPYAATALTGVGHAMVLIDSEGRWRGTHLWLLHVNVEGDRAEVSDCELRLGPKEDLSCPPAPVSLVECASWSLPADAARAAIKEARSALFLRVHEKKYLSGPREEIESEDGVFGGVVGGVSGGTTHDFAVAASVRESATMSDASEYRVRVAEEWAGYASAREAGRFVRADAATDVLREAFPQPDDAKPSAPTPAMHAEFSHLFATLPFGGKGSWWWVQERMVLMAGTLGLPADLERLEKYLQGSGNLRAYALEALARRTGRDTRCDGNRRLDDADAAAAWKRLSKP